MAINVVTSGFAAALTPISQPTTATEARMIQPVTSPFGDVPAPVSFTPIFRFGDAHAPQELIASSMLPQRAAQPTSSAEPHVAASQQDHPNRDSCYASQFCDLNAIGDVSLQGFDDLGLACLDSHYDDYDGFAALETAASIETAAPAQNDIYFTRVPVTGGTAAPTPAIVT